MAAEATPTKAWSECASRIHQELANVQPALSKALSGAEALLPQAQTISATEALAGLRVLAQASARVYRLSRICGDALDAVEQVMGPLGQLHRAHAAELDYWKRRALGQEGLGDGLEGVERADADQAGPGPSPAELGGIGSPLHEAIAARLDATLVAELEADAMARLAQRR
jgi:hypothetical protein